MLQQLFVEVCTDVKKVQFHTLKTCHHWSTPDVNKADHSPGQYSGFTTEVMSLLSAPYTH